MNGRRNIFTVSSVSQNHMLLLAWWLKPESLAAQYTCVARAPLASSLAEAQVQDCISGIHVSSWFGQHTWLVTDICQHWSSLSAINKPVSAYCCMDK